MKLTSYPFGSVRFTLGLVLLLGAAGSADHQALPNWNWLPLTLLGLFFLAWAVSRLENHTGLKRLLRQIHARLPRTRRHQRIYRRAAR
ncbi:hypothetical protein [Deinococcus ruber]|uniref:Uncharacterized protein n=1 Tax=Deinococcus ruber TaxID=1848197 RepID=A0A918CE05_9DEIO|nr:hypothetical protein [Deinococcus ruber]GGR16369.1 hypothetical protein GCM10008957_31270 [Deinococcus ruber]